MDAKGYDEGMAIRREVLGDEYVDKTLSKVNAFNAPLNELVTANCWGAVWTRETLPKRTRSLITVATLAALRATAELKTHVRGALRNGCTVAEIQDVLLQSAVYCGVPAGIEAFRAAKEVVDSWED